MVAKSTKRTPSQLDFDIWRMMFIENKSRAEIAQATGKAITTVDYHIGEGKRLIGVDIAKVKTDVQSLMIPVALDSIATIANTMRQHNPKYVDAAIKFLRNAGYTIEQSEVSHVLKDSRSADQDFDDLMKKMKERAVDATVIDDKQAVNSDQATSIVSVDESSDDQPGSSASTSTSIQESDVSILPLTESHTENPKLEE